MNLHLFSQALDTSFAWVWKTSLQATVLIALVMLIQRVFKRVLAPRWRYALGLLVLLRLALPVVPAATFSIFNLAHHLPAENLRMGRIGPMGQMGPAQPVGNPAPMSKMIQPTTHTEPAPPQRKSTPLPILEFVWLAGCIAMLGAAARQQWKLSRQLRRQLPLTEPRIIALLDNCQALLGVKRHVMVLPSATLNTPALFGTLRPRLLIPEAMLRRLDDRELRLIFLHELTHLQRGDILANWAMIFLRSLHWFNPAVWLALKRLRADQELACDAAVMSRLAADERRLYGDTLIKLLADFSVSPFCPGLVPFITNQQLIKRRITMISKFQPASRFTLIVSVALLITIGCFTFTRAADNAGDSPKNSNSASSTATAPAPTGTANAAAAERFKAERLLIEQQHADQVKAQLNAATKQAAEALQLQEATAAPAKAAQIKTIMRNIQVLVEQELGFERDMKQKQEILEALRKQLAIPNDIAEGKTVSNSENTQHLESIRIESETQYVRKNTLLESLKKLNHDELRDTMPTAAPDVLLTSDLEQLDQAETKLVALSSDYGGEHPSVVKARQLVAKLDKKIDDRLQGILKGMEVEVAALKAVVDNASLKIAQTRKEDSESAEKYRPYFGMKYELEHAKKMWEELRSREQHEQIELELLRNTVLHGWVYLQGAVHSPGPQEIRSDEAFTLSEAIQRAGGLTDYAKGRKVRITRKDPNGGKDQQIYVDVEKILQHGNKEGDMVLELDDLIMIDESGIRF